MPRSARTASPPCFGVLVTIYFWWSNIKGIHESSGKALRIMQITTVMVVAFLIWCPLTMLLRGHAQLPPAPVPRNLHFSDDALGLVQGHHLAADRLRSPSIIAFGHSLLSMSGFETLAQVYREIAYPEAEEPEDHRQHRLHLRGGLHGRDHAVRRHDHPRRHPRQVRRQSAGRPRHASGRAGSCCGWCSTSSW